MHRINIAERGLERFVFNVLYSQRTSWAVGRFLGSLTSIFRMRSFALSDILGQGSETKSSSPFKTCSNIPCSVSEHKLDKG